LRRNFFLKHVTEGKREGMVEVMGREKIRKTREDAENLKTKSTRWHSAENSPWKKL
jgi:hypothetical protein